MQRIIGESTTLAAALDHVSALAPLSRPVLVLGERGSGKELMAERLHFLSTRWDGPLIKVNCAAISEELIDSALFGHEPGAFTGASTRHLGHFERADGGTLFLDELATLPLRTQEKLLRIVEYGEFERLGGQKTLSVNVRLVGATHANLPKLVKEGGFRGDLLDRLAFDVVPVPPLRARQEDIPVLVDHFALQMCHELGWEYYSGFTQEALNALLAYAWPGNIRELKNVVERSVHRWGSNNTPIETVVINPFPKPYDLPGTSDTTTPPDPREPTQPPSPGHSTTPSSSPSPTGDIEALGFTQCVQNYEIALVQQALEANQHHQQKTANALGLTYHQLRALLRKYKGRL